jgi:hypothetical protein
MIRAKIGGGALVQPTGTPSKALCALLVDILCLVLAAVATALGHESRSVGSVQY